MTITYAYFDCFSGISGDMTLGALIDLGAPLERLRTDLKKLAIGPFGLSADAVAINGIRAVQVKVEVPTSEIERHFSDIRTLIDKSSLPLKVKSTAIDTFSRLAAAEAGIHGCSPDEVHFHEVGAVDAIVDIVGAALCLDYLGIERITASPLPMGTGFVNCRHGKLPLPAPATLSLLKNVPIRGIAVEGEFVTPTGAALIAGLAESFGPYPDMELLGVGYGAGRHRYDHQPNLLRVVLGRPAGADTRDEKMADNDRVEVIETAIDDLNPEVFGYLMERLFEINVLDVYWIPVYMKKNRPGTLVQVLCRPERVEATLNVIFNETTTLGVRIYPASRRVLPRETVSLDTSLGKVSVKRVLMPDGHERLIPEYEVCRRLAREHKVPVKDIYAIVEKEASGVLRLDPEMSVDKPEASIDKKAH
ncbi:MAG: nickel pincer cofactor biosynthesis protein LarC [Desulfosarcina sp.]|nr:nickel pincer cofactor biosynthesis protein LarC [Desulfobacterales bacterium]